MSNQIKNPVPSDKVIAAINCACANLTARGEDMDGKAVAQIASDLLRVAAWLEAGNLMPVRKEGGAQ